MNPSTKSINGLYFPKAQYIRRYSGNDHVHPPPVPPASTYGARPTASRSTSMSSMYRRFNRALSYRAMGRGRWEEDSDTVSLVNIRYEDTEDPKESDQHIVRWNGEDDPENPLNWSQGRKWTATLVVSLFTFLAPFASTMVTPALDEIGTQYMIPPGFARQLVMSIFLFGFAVGPFTLAPLSEIYGRVRVLQYANVIFLVFNTACPFARTKEVFYVLRVLSGIGGSAPQALGNGVLADCWCKEERGKGQAIYGMLTFLSPCVAPIMGAFVVGRIYWGWIFWITSILNVMVQLVAVFFLRETYPPKILRDRAKKLRKETGNGKWRTEYDDPARSGGSIVRRRLVLPFVMLFTHPAVQVPSLYRAVLYGTMYLVLSTFQQVWVGTYAMTKEIASLNYLSLAIGFIIGLQTSQLLMDKLYAYLKHRNQMEEGLPEWRIPPMVIGGILAPAGLVLYGWAAQHQLLWVVPDVGCIVFAYGLIISFQSAQAYVTDAYGHAHAASAAAVGAFMRTVAGFGFPLFAPALYGALGLGLGNTVLAGSAFVLMILGPVFMWFYGARMRAWSKMGL